MRDGQILWLQINFFELNFFVDVLLVYIERRSDEKAYSADGNGADKPGSEKGGNLVSKFTDLHHQGLEGAAFGQEGELPGWKL